jgi:hypothetical protein
MSHHFERLEEVKATRKRLKKENPSNPSFVPLKQKMALGNINEFNELTLAIANPGIIIGKAGFSLAKAGAKGGMNIVRNVLNRGKKLLNTRAGKLVQKHADDAAAVYSIGNQIK